MMSVIFASVLVLITPIFSFVDLTVHAIGHRSQSDAEAILFGEEFAERVSSIHAGNARLRELRAACNASSFLGPTGAATTHAAAYAVVKIQDAQSLRLKELVLRYRMRAQVEWNPRPRLPGSCKLPGDLNLGEPSRLAHFRNQFAGATIAAFDRWSKASWDFDRADVRALP